MTEHAFERTAGDGVLRPYTLTGWVTWALAIAGGLIALGAFGWSVARHEPGNLFTPQPGRTAAWALGTGAVVAAAALVSGALTFPRMSRATPAPAGSMIELPHSSIMRGVVATLIVAALPALIGGVIDEGHEYIATAGGAVAGAGIGLAITARRISRWERARGVKLVGDRPQGGEPRWHTVSAEDFDAGCAAAAAADGEKASAGDFSFRRTARVRIATIEFEGLSLRGRVGALALGFLVGATGVVGVVMAAVNPPWSPWGPPAVGKCVDGLGLDLEIRACWDGQPRYEITKRVRSDEECEGSTPIYATDDEVWCMRRR